MGGAEVGWGGEVWPRELHKARRRDASDSDPLEREPGSCRAPAKRGAGPRRPEPGSAGAAPPPAPSPRAPALPPPTPAQPTPAPAPRAEGLVLDGPREGASPPRMGIELGLVETC